MLKLCRILLASALVVSNAIAPVSAFSANVPQASVADQIANPPGADAGFVVRNITTAWKREDIGTGWATAKARQVLSAGDMDGNGYADMLLWDKDGKLWFYPAKSATKFSPRKLAGTGWNSLKYILGGVDFDGDRKIDILGIDKQGRLLLYPGKGNGKVGSKLVLGSGWGNITKLSITQKGFNGHPIIMGINKSGVLQAWPTNGKGKFNSKITYGNGWNSIPHVHITSDVSGDNIPDLWAITNTGELRLYVSRNKAGTKMVAYKVGTGWSGVKYFFPGTTNSKVVRAIFPDGKLRQYTLTKLVPWENGGLPASTSTNYPTYEGWKVAQLSGGANGGRTVAVLVEPGLNIDPNQAAKFVRDTLNDKRGWAGKGKAIRLVTTPKTADLVFYIAKPKTVDKYCYPLQTQGEVSCTASRHKIYLNSNRWLYGVKHIPNLDQYRRYLVSHEYGHSVGYKHKTCPGKGKPAPVMLQQTYGLGGCKANEWITVA